MSPSSSEKKHLNYIYRPKPANSVFSVMSFRPVSPPSNIAKIEDSSSSLTFLDVDRNGSQDDYQPRRRVSSVSNINKGKQNGLLTSSTSNLAGDGVLTSENVVQLKVKLRKTGFAENNQTLRRKLPTETVQMDFRSVLRSSKNNLTTK